MEPKDCKTSGYLLSGSGAETRSHERLTGSVEYEGKGGLFNARKTKPSSRLDARVSHADPPTLSQAHG